MVLPLEIASVDNRPEVNRTDIRPSYVNKGYYFVLPPCMAKPGQEWSYRPVPIQTKERHDMVRLRSIPGIAIVVAVFATSALSATSSEGNPSPCTAETIQVKGRLKTAEGDPIANGTVTVEWEDHGKTTVRRWVSDQGGRFTVKSPRGCRADIMYEAKGYGPIEESGLVLTEEIDLRKILKEEWSFWGLVVLLIPGVLGLLMAAVKEPLGRWVRKKLRESGDKLQGSVGTDEQGSEKVKDQTTADSAERDNRFLVAFLSGFIWTGTLALLFWMPGAECDGVFKLYRHLSFEFYVPVLGFVGSLLYVLDLGRRSKEDIPRGAEFGLRMIMGPYVAIIMVLLFANNLQFVNLESHVAKGAVAFFSGLLVVLALQGLIERGNEWLGKWRRESRYEPSEVAEKFGLTQEEDMKLRKGEIHHLVQLRERDEAELRKDMRKVGFDENFAVDLKKRLQEEKMLQNFLGELVTNRLIKEGVYSLTEFAQLRDQPLQKIADMDPKVDHQALKGFRDQAKQGPQPKKP